MPLRHPNRRADKGTKALDKLIEEATVDCYDESEQAIGLCTMIEENLAVPFKTKILGVDVSVTGIETGDDGIAKAICERGRERQLISVTDLPLPKPSPEGAEWIAAYRRWLGGR
jgi:hypothetical protein